MPNYLNAGNKEWLVYANNINSTANSNLTFSAKDGSGVFTVGSGYVAIPHGPSFDEIGVAEIGALRIDTGLNAVRFLTAQGWQSLSVQPTITSSSPQYIQSNVSDNSINIIGANFSSTVVVQFQSTISNNIYNAASQNRISDTQIVAVVSNTVRDLSNEDPFNIVVTNDTGLQAILANGLYLNEVPTWVTNAAPTVYASIGNDMTLSGELDVSAVDTDAHYPLTYTSSDLSDNTGLQLTSVSNTGRVSGSVSGLTASTYNFAAIVTDAALGAVPRNFTFQVLEPTSVNFSIAANQIDTYYVDSNNDPVGGPVIGGYVIYDIYDHTSASAPGVTLTGTYQVNYSGTNDMDFVVLGGGGGAGAYYNSGGGGAGGFMTSFTTTQGTSGGGGAYEDKMSFSSSSAYTIIIGAGSQGITGDGGDGTLQNGSISLISYLSGASVFTKESKGGGYGGLNQPGAYAPGGAPSAATGGGSRGVPANNSDVGGTGRTAVLYGGGGTYGNGQGYGGGSNAEYSGFYASGGGGGVGQAGQSSPNNQTAGNGGDGLETQIRGTSRFIYLGGGGGGSSQGTTDTATYPNLFGTGGQGGGGNGAFGGGSGGSPQNGSSGTNGTGGGGGGGSGNGVSGDPAARIGGSGGSGRIILRLPAYHS
jgi:hypothetical protein